MLTGNKIIYFLAFQKVLPLSKLIDKLGLNKEELVFLTSQYKRGIGSRPSFIYDKTKYDKIWQRELIKYMYEEKENENLLENVKRIFNVDEFFLAEYLYYLKNEIPALGPLLFYNEKLENQLKIVKLEKEKNVLKGKKVKKIKGNETNTQKLIELAKTTSIEEIALEMNVSPYIIKKELAFNMCGGYWGNENIRKSLYMVTEASDCYQIEEILYILNYKNEYSEKELAEKLKTTEKNLKEFFTKINDVLTIYSVQELKKILIEYLHEYRRFFGSMQLESLITFEKDTKEYLFRYKVTDLILESEQETISKYYKEIYDQINKNRKYILKNKGGIHIVDSKKTEYNGTKIGENFEKIIIRELITNNQREVYKEDIIQIQEY